jgi:hypothetical protein
MIVLLVEWSGMARPRARVFRATEMQVHGLLNGSLLNEHLQLASVDGVNVTVLEQHPRAVLITLVPADDRTRIAVQVDLVI